MAEREVEQWITVNGNHIPIFKGQSKEEAVKKFISHQTTNKGENKRSAESLIPKDSYTKKPEYQTALNWFKEHAGERDRLTKTHLDLIKQLDAERDKHLDPEDVKLLGRAQARMFVNDSDYPETAELKDRYNKIGNELKQYDEERSRYQDILDRKDRANAEAQRMLYGKPEFKEAHGDYTGFKTSESTTPYVDDLVKEGKAKVVEMTPEQYIHECAHYIFENSTFERVLRGRVGDKSTEKYAQMMREGTKFDTPYINYGRTGDQVGNQEGLHRAVAAYINGIEKIPVIIIGKRRF